MRHFYIQFKHDCERAATILKNSPTATSVAVTLSNTDRGFRFMDSPDQDHIGQTIVDLLFRAAYEDRAQLELTALCFYGLCLARAGDLVRKLILLEGLQHLQLLRCNDVYPFLEAVTQKYSGLQTFVLKHCQGGPQIGALNNFLRVATPRRLVVRLLQGDGPYFKGSGAVMFDTLSPYAHTIQCLV